MAILHVVVAVHNAYKIVEGNRNDAKVDRNIGIYTWAYYVIGVSATSHL